MALEVEMTSYYEVEITRNLSGLTEGVVYLIDGNQRTRVGNAGGPMGGHFASRDAVIRAARQIAHEHRKGPDIVRLDLDEPRGTP